MSRFLVNFLVLFSLALSSTLQSQNIRDYAQFFSVQATTKAQEKIETLEKKLGVSNLIILETFASIPAGTDLKSFYKKHFPREKDFTGVYILLSKKPKKILFGSSRKMAKIISKTSLDESRKLFIASFKAKNFDQGLENSLNYLSNEIVVAYQKPKKQTQLATTQSTVQKSSSSFPWSRIIIWGAIILCILFLVSKLFNNNRRDGSPFPSRDMNRNDPNQDNWNRGNGGGAGSGILGSVLGGIGGAMAGNWLYDKLSGSSTPAASQPPANEPTVQPQAEQPVSSNEPDIGDVSGDFSSGDDWGGDFGDSGGDDW